MELIKSFAIFKNAEKKADNQPDYRISVKVGDKYVDAGAAWIKEGKSGKFLSAKLSDARDVRPGFRLEVELPKVQEQKDIASEDVPF